MIAIHRLIPTIDVYVEKIGRCKAFMIIDYSDQVNSMWKCRVHETGRVINAYDDQIAIYPNYADGEKELIIPEDWKSNKNKSHVQEKKRLQSRKH